MLTKNTIKEITSLRVKKYRWESGLFLAEGERLVEDLVQSSLEIDKLFLTSGCKLNIKSKNLDTMEITDNEMKKISNLSTPSSILAVVNIPVHDILTLDFSSNLTIALDDIQDPGNLGTIIRLADWFGVDSIICSNSTVDAYSSKVIQACMGSISRVKIFYCDLLNIIPKLSKDYNLKVYGTFMEGKNIYNELLSKNGIVIMGNEGNGISKIVEKTIDHKLHIPDFAISREKVESLNVATATAIVLSEFRRRFSLS